jgi:hypothetical protein
MNKPFAISLQRNVKAAAFALVLVLLPPLLILVLSPFSKLEIFFSFELSQNSK